MAIKRGKIVIIGASNVGSAVANKIADFELASEIAFIDINQDKAKGEALDSSHATSSIFSMNIQFHAGDYDDCKNAEIVIITAGPSIKPGEKPDRLILANTNAKIMRAVFGEVQKRTKEAKVIMITNPLDVATYVVSTEFDYPREKIVGTGTMLETMRFRRILADRYRVDPKNINGYVLGEHGNAAFVAWSTVNVAGLGLEHLDEYFKSEAKLDRKEVEQQIVNVAYDIVNLKGFTNTGIAMAACRFIKSVEYDEHTIIPCSAVMNGEYGIKDVALSLPRMVTGNGLLHSFAPHLTDAEVAAMEASAKSVRAALDGAGVR